VADVFVSYSRLDRALAEELARLLKSSGFDVWWDHDLLGTTSYRDQIKKKLAEAKAVIVIWSVDSVESAWVIDEAEEAKSQKKLVPARAPGFDFKHIPLGFRQFSTDPIDKPELIVRSLAALGVEPSLPHPKPAQSSAATGETAIDPINPTDAESFTAWEQIKDRKDPLVLIAYVDRFPHSPLAELARSRVNAMEEAAWRAEIERTDDPGKLREFIATYADGQYLLQARRQLYVLESQAWSTVDKNDGPALVRLLEQFPDGFSANEVRNRLTELREKELETQVWGQLEGAPTKKGIESYIANFPLGAHVDEARRLLAPIVLAERRAERWNKIKDQNFSEQLQSFILEFRDGPEVEEARSRLALRLREKEALDWDKLVNERHPAAFLRFLKTYPNGEHEAEALARLKELPHLIETESWAEIEGSGDSRLAQFLSALPNGQFAQRAAERLTGAQREAFALQFASTPAPNKPLEVAPASATHSNGQQQRIEKKSTDKGASITPTAVPRWKFWGRRILSWIVAIFAGFGALVTVNSFDLSLLWTGAAALAVLAVMYLHSLSSDSASPRRPPAASGRAHAFGSIVLFACVLALQGAIWMSVNRYRIWPLENEMVVITLICFLLFATLWIALKRNRISERLYRVLAKIALLLFAFNAAIFFGRDFAVEPLRSIYVALLPYGSFGTVHLQQFGSIAFVIFTIMWLNKRHHAAAQEKDHSVQRGPPKDAEALKPSGTAA
jgi:TIR domain